MDSDSNNKRIAKNTFFLYGRMFVIMVVTLYTSRVLLHKLGVEDFGVYNLVASVVVLFSFINGIMTNASQRFLCAAIGKNDSVYIQKVFSTGMTLHILLAIAVFILAEILGVWFITSELNIPDNRQNAAMWIYQISILTASINVIKIPYNAAIISYERMNFFAYTTLIDAILKLVVVWLLVLLPFDRLISYSFLLLAVSMLMVFWYREYCLRHFENCRYEKRLDKSLVKEMASFSGWNLFGALGDVAYKQGTGLILNVFYGVTLNATLGVTNQVRSAAYSFVSNLQTSANPQIIKSYITKNFDYYQTLVCQISKYSYFIMLLISLPIIINVDFILYLWLKQPPEYTNIFVILIMVFSLGDALHGPLWTTVQACGKLKWYQFTTCLCLLLNLPFTYLILLLGFHPASMLVIQIIISVLTLVVRLIFSHNIAGIDYKTYIRKTIFPIIAVSVLAIPISTLSYLFANPTIRFFVSCVICLCATLASVYFVGLNSYERNTITHWIRHKFSK